MRMPFTTPAPRKGMPDPHLDHAAFVKRFRSQFAGQAFDALGPDLHRTTEAAWQEYHVGNKSPRTRKAGEGYHDPDYDLSVDWIEARAALEAAAARQRDPSRPRRILLVNGSPRSEHTCPSEMSKSFRLDEIARETLEAGGAETEVLDLSRLEPFRTRPGRGLKRSMALLTAPEVTKALSTNARTMTRFLLI